jgi:hypothetical protein
MAQIHIKFNSLEFHGRENPSRFDTIMSKVLNGYNFTLQKWLYDERYIFLKICGATIQML